MDIGKNHQVLAYAYRQDGQKVDLWIYDPNHPNENNATLTFDITDTSGEVHVTRTFDQATRIWCFFKTTGYSERLPPRGRRLSPVTVDDLFNLAQAVNATTLGRIEGEIKDIRALLDAVNGMTLARIETETKDVKALLDAVNATTLSRIEEKINAVKAKV